MTEKWITAGVTVAVAIIGLAGIAALLSKNSNTVGVIGAGSNGLACLLCAVVRPVGVTCTASCGTSPQEIVTSNITFGT